MSCCGTQAGWSGRVAPCRRLSLADRATMVPLLAALVDYDSSPATYQRYDQMTALELFQKCVGLRGYALHERPVHAPCFA